jgi:hypothetical protein
MARLRRHDPAGRRRGFALDCGDWTLRTTPRADRLFRVSRHYRDGARVPTLVVRTLVHLGEATPEDPTPKAEVTARFPRLNPGRCEVDDAALAELRTFAERRLRDAGLSPGDLAALNEFLREQTPLAPFEGDAYRR